VQFARLGIGGADPDTFNRLSVNSPASLLNNDGAGHEVTINKAATGDDASVAFKVGFSARALMGLLGSAAWSLKVSPDGSAFADALIADPDTARVELPQPLVLGGQAAMPAAPPAGRLALYARSRVGSLWPEVRRPSGRDFPLQPHLGVNRIATWSPNTTTSIIGSGLPNTLVGTRSTPAITATSLATSMRRWRVTSAAAANSAAEDRSQQPACLRGAVPGMGGFTFVTRVSLVTLQAAGMGFFGLIGSTTALATTLTLAAVVNAVGVGFEIGTHANLQVVSNDAAGSPALVDCSSGFAVATGGVFTVFLSAPANGSGVWVRVVNEDTGDVFETEVTADLPADTQVLSPRLYLNNGGVAAAVAYECAGLYIETDF
jgi:hypothetical protein